MVPCIFVRSGDSIYWENFHYDHVFHEYMKAKVFKILKKIILREIAGLIMNYMPYLCEFACQRRQIQLNKIISRIGSSEDWCLLWLNDSFCKQFSNDHIPVDYDVIKHKDSRVAHPHDYKDVYWRCAHAKCKIL